MFSYEQIIGNEQIVKNLKQRIDSGKISHAYIIDGSAGMGKKMLAKTFAKALQCTAVARGTPCGICTSCKVFETENHPDIFMVHATKGKSIGVDDIREQVVKKVAIKPYQYKYKIFIIDMADKMTVQAQNALLKSLEEPPNYCIMILLSENSDTLLQTILSRCVLLKLRPLPASQIEVYLKKNEIGEKDNIKLYTEYAQGSIGKAIAIAQSEEFHKMREDVCHWVLDIDKCDLVTVMGFAKEMEVYKDNTQYLDMMSLWYRDLLISKLCRDNRYIIQKDKVDLIEKQVILESEEGLLKKSEAIWQSKKQLKQNANFLLAMEVMLIKLKESSNL